MLPSQLVPPLYMVIVRGRRVEELGIWREAYLDEGGDSTDAILPPKFLALFALGWQHHELVLLGPG